MQKKLKDIASTRKVFPKSFMWGASIASHQVEGSNHNQWTAWEHETAARAAKLSSQKLDHLPVWGDIKKQATDPHNYISGRGVDHYHKYKLDFQLARKLNLNAMRTGIEWARVNPSEGMLDLAEIGHYNNYLSAMKDAGLVPILNLFHWTMPVWFAELGGFTKRQNMRHWEAYVHSLVENLDLIGVKHILVINEANTYASLSYLFGEFAPGEKNFLTAYRTYRNLARAHQVAYKIIKARYPGIQVGSAHQCNNVMGSGVIGWLPAQLQQWAWNWSWLKWSKHHDFVGFNYYFTDRWHNFSRNIGSWPNPGTQPVNDLGWHMDPAGVEKVIRQIAKRHKGKPIMITENGVADMHDQYREWWLAETIEAIARCIRDGIPVIGYMHWSLLDNFEWQYGWWPKFGMISVNRKTMQRTVKKSARLWSAWLG